MRFLKMLMLLVLSVFFVTGNAMAITYTFGDDYANWPGATFPTGWDDKDENGTPEISGGSITFSDTGNFLESITLNMDGRRVWDSLFINNDGGGLGEQDYDEWDYYVRDDEADATGAHFYKIPEPDEAGYTYTATYDTGARIGHYNGIDTTDWSETSGFLESVIYKDGALTYMFSPEKIFMSEGWVIGYTPWCANDVVLVKGAAPVPEPATMLLLGTGLIGLAGVGRKRLIKKS